MATLGGGRDQQLDDHVIAALLPADQVAFGEDASAGDGEVCAVVTREVGTRAVGIREVAIRVVGTREGRSDERVVGQECVSKCIARVSAYHFTNKNTKTKR